VWLATTAISPGAGRQVCRIVTCHSINRPLSATTKHVVDHLATCGPWQEWGSSALVLRRTPHPITTSSTAGGRRSTHRTVLSLTGCQDLPACGVEHEMIATTMALQRTTVVRSARCTPRRHMWGRVGPALLYITPPRQQRAKGYRRKQAQWSCGECIAASLANVWGRTWPQGASRCALFCTTVHTGAPNPHPSTRGPPGTVHVQPRLEAPQHGGIGAPALPRVAGDSRWTRRYFQSFSLFFCGGRGTRVRRDARARTKMRTL